MNSGKITKTLVYGLAAASMVIPPVMAVDEVIAPAESQAQAESKTLWTLPQYEVKVKEKKAAATAAPAQTTPTTPAEGGTTEEKSATTSASDSNSASQDDENRPKRRRRRPRRHKEQSETESEKPKQSDYDADAAKAFEQSNAAKTQYVWSRQPAASKPYAKTTAQELDDFNRDLTDKIASNLKVPSTATLVETSNKKYSYIIGFTLLKSGQVANFQIVNQAGNVSTVPLADPGESDAVVQALQDAIKKACPIKAPPGGIPPWNMIAVYDMSTGKLFTSLYVR